jgi:hypothetical protein
MNKVCFLRDCVVDGICYGESQVILFPDDEALALIERGDAEAAPDATIYGEHLSRLANQAAA